MSHAAHAALRIALLPGEVCSATLGESVFMMCSAKVPEEQAPPRRCSKTGTSVTVVVAVLRQVPSGRSFLLRGTHGGNQGEKGESKFKKRESL